MTAAIPYDELTLDELLERVERIVSRAERTLTKGKPRRLSAAELERENRMRSVVFCAPKNLYSKRWQSTSNWQASLPSALGSLGTIRNMRKLNRAVFELTRMFACSIPKALLQKVFALILSLVFGIGLEDDTPELPDEHRDIDVTPRPEPPLSRIPKALPNAPNALI